MDTCCRSSSAISLTTASPHRRTSSTIPPKTMRETMTRHPVTSRSLAQCSGSRCVDKFQRAPRSSSTGRAGDISQAAITTRSRCGYGTRYERGRLRHAPVEKWSSRRIEGLVSRAKALVRTHRGRRYCTTASGGRLRDLRLCIAVRLMHRSSPSAAKRSRRRRQPSPAPSRRPSPTVDTVVRVRAAPSPVGRRRDPARSSA